MTGLLPLAGLPRWRWGDLLGFPIGPFIADIHSFDITETMVGCVRNAAPNCVAIVFVDRAGSKTRRAVESAAGARGLQILWEDRVADAGLADGPDTCGIAPASLIVGQSVSPAPGAPDPASWPAPAAPSG